MLQLLSNIGMNTICPAYRLMASSTWLAFTLPVSVTKCHSGITIVRGLRLSDLLGQLSAFHQPAESNRANPRARVGMAQRQRVVD